MLSPFRIKLPLDFRSCKTSARSSETNSMPSQSERPTRAPSSPTSAPVAPPGQAVTTRAMIVPTPAEATRLKSSRRSLTSSGQLLADTDPQRRSSLGPLHATAIWRSVRWTSWLKHDRMSRLLLPLRSPTLLPLCRSASSWFARSPLTWPRRPVDRAETVGMACLFTPRRDACGSQ